MCKKSAVPLFAATAALILTSTALAQFTLQPVVNHVVGANPTGVINGDFDGDGDMDLAATSDAPDKVTILLNNGSGVFTAGAVIILPNASGAGDIVAGTLDADGDLDLAVALHNQASVRILLNNGNATFALGATVAVGANPRGMDIADVDGDKDMDISVANRDGNSVSILKNSGTATFTTTTLPAGAEPRDSGFGDFDHDGDMDLAVTNHDDRSISIYANSAGTFALATTLSVGSQDRPDRMDIADLNGDQRDDIAAASGDDTPNFNRVVLFTANSTTSFNGPTFANAGPGALNTSDVAIVDLDCDGDLDLATANKATNNISLIPRLAGLTFGAPMLVPTGGLGPDVIIAANLDADADSDLAVVNSDGNTITVVLNTTCAAPVFADLTGDGHVGPADLASLLAAWGACQVPSSCPADLNHDGTVGPADLALLLSHWG